MGAKQLAKSLEQGPESFPFHGWDQVEEHLSLAEAQVLPRPGRTEPSVHAEFLAGLAEYCQQRVRQHCQPEEGVAAVVALPDRVLPPQPQAGVRHVAERLVHRATCAVAVRAGRALESAAAAREPPRLLH